MIVPLVGLVLGEDDLILLSFCAVDVLLLSVCNGWSRAVFSLLLA